MSTDRDSLDRTLMLATLAAAGGRPPHCRHASAAEPTTDDPNWKITKGRINQSVVAVVLQADAGRRAGPPRRGAGPEIGRAGPAQPIGRSLKKHGLTCAIAGSHGFVKGWNHKENWDFCTEKHHRSRQRRRPISAARASSRSPACAATCPPAPKGDEIGKKNFVEGIKRVLPLAEQKKVTLALEMLNSRVDVEMKGHPGYQCDTIEWAVDVCNRVGSDRLKILFDIYHVQIMQGDVIVRLKNTRTTSPTTTPPAIPAATRSTTRRRSTIPAS